MAVGLLAEKDPGFGNERDICPPPMCCALPRPKDASNRGRGSECHGRFGELLCFCLMEIR